MNAFLAQVETSLGLLAIAVDAEGALLGLQFGDGTYTQSLEDRLRKRGYAPQPEHDANAAVRQQMADVRQQLAEYGDGTRQHFTLPLTLIGTPWQVAVWQALQRIPYGETRTYVQVAEMINHPTAARAVGRANATNHLPLVIPCHRVIGADGSLTGFAGGTHLKTRLLAHEARGVAIGA